ncbi:uncharacterized protein H6S33_004423 [Morchella sextelata]|uniref:uncharacterized protein n=1 Tax=Morchella sextelata TaxID=1174677 RepID=UPI001D04503E|nr:uncharacterized protein H6S33_004423 [Morchella sextelata]KAH0605966.1 hypothetical protein H6S33_004423 [Morchella sextelata]
MSSSHEKILTESLQEVEKKYLERCAKHDTGIRPRFRMSCRPIAPCLAQQARRRTRRQPAAKKTEAQANPKPIVKGESSNPGKGGNKIKKTKNKSTCKATAVEGAKVLENADPAKLKD